MQLVYSLKAIDKFCSSVSEAENTNENNIQLIRRALPRVIEERLSDRQKDCIRLYYFENLNMNQTAAALGIERSTVSRTLKRARSKIKLSLEYII